MEETPNDKLAATNTVAEQYQNIVNNVSEYKTMAIIDNVLVFVNPRAKIKEAHLQTNVSGNIIEIPERLNCFFNIGGATVAYNYYGIPMDKKGKKVVCEIEIQQKTRPYGNKGPKQFIINCRSYKESHSPEHVLIGGPANTLDPDECSFCVRGATGYVGIKLFRPLVK